MRVTGVPARSGFRRTPKTDVRWLHFAFHPARVREVVRPLAARWGRCGPLGRRSGAWSCGERSSWKSFAHATFVPGRFGRELQRFDLARADPGWLETTICGPIGKMVGSA